MRALAFVYLLIECCTASISSLKEEALKNREWQVGVRRWLHQHPELQFAERETSKRIQEELKQLGVKFTTGWGKRTLANGTVIGGTGVVAEIGTGSEPCVGLRADFDALPILEKTPVDYRSLNEGVMHACGHDAHTTMLLGAVRLLKSRDTIKGTVRFVFQPAEEGGAGAECMVNEGVLTKEPRVQSMFGLHVAPPIPTGIIASRPGPLMASEQSFRIRVEGEGGHAAMSYLAKDPVPLAALIIQALQNVVSRSTSVTDFQHAGVISVTAMESPQSYNVIPPYVEMKGTIRALNAVKMSYLKSRVKSVAEGISQSFEQTATVIFGSISYPPTINDPKLFTWTKETLKPDVNILEIPPIMGAEDFSYYGSKVPSNFLFIGIGSGSNPPTNVTLHSDHFAVDENVLPIGSAVLAHLALERIQALGVSATQTNTKSPEL